MEENLGLCHLCARRFSGKGIEYDDLFQAACLGLIKAAGRFERERGLKFSTYAVPVILGEIRRLFRDGGAVRVSRGLKELSRRAYQARDRFESAEGRSPDLEELAALLGVTRERAALALGAGRAPLSLSGGEDGETIDVPVEALEEHVTERLTLTALLRALPEGDRKLLELRYFGGKTQQQTAQALGMTQVQVSRREKKLLLRLREEMGG